MSKQLKVSAGSVALVLAGVGVLGRIVFVANRPQELSVLERVADMSQQQFLLGGISAICVVAAGLVGVFAAVRNDGRGPGLIAIAISLLWFVLMFFAGAI